MKLLPTAIGGERIARSCQNVVAGHRAEIREADDQIWQVSFLGCDLGYLDNERGRVEPGRNPFAPDKVLAMCPEQGVNHVTGIHLVMSGGGEGRRRTVLLPS